MTQYKGENRQAFVFLDSFGCIRYPNLVERAPQGARPLSWPTLKSGADLQPLRLLPTTLRLALGCSRGLIRPVVLSCATYLLFCRGRPAPALACAVQEVQPRKFPWLSFGEGAKRRVFRWAWYLGFGCVAIVALAAVLVFVGLLGAYAYSVTQNGDLSNVVGSMVEFVLGGAAVLAIEYLLRQVNDKN